MDSVSTAELKYYPVWIFPFEIQPSIRNSLLLLQAVLTVSHSTVVTI